jgi:hypothetical protein
MGKLFEAVEAMWGVDRSASASESGAETAINARSM